MLYFNYIFSIDFFKCKNDKWFVLKFNYFFEMVKKNFKLFFERECLNGIMLVICNKELFGISNGIFLGFLKNIMR